MKSRYLYSFSFAFLFCFIESSAQDSLFTAPERGFVSWLPAQKWEHSLLSGNGTMGALVFGNPHEETIILSHSDLYLPLEKSDKLINQASWLEDIRNLIRSGKYEEAAEIPVQLRQESGYSDDRDPFIPAFDVEIVQQPGNISRYMRSTDFATGEAVVNWHDTNGIFQRKLFVSRADTIIVLKIASDAPINCKISFATRPVDWDQWSFVGEHVDEMKSAADELWLTYRSSFKKKHKKSIEGYEGVGRVVLTGGSSKVVNNAIEISDADEVLVLIKIKPTNSYHQSTIHSLKQELSSCNANYEELLKKHTAIHGKIFKRMKLDLNGNPDDRKLYSEEILLKAKEQEIPLALIEKVFDAGRYNILSSTGTNPPNLQGIWSGTWTAPWSSGFTHDGNLPAAMAVVVPGNMPELMNAYAGYLHRHMDEFKENAQLLFGTRGINLPAHTTTTGWPTDFNKTWCLSFWTGGAGWAADLLFDYYSHTNNQQFLVDYAYPWVKNSALFYEDFLINGGYIFNPSYSPENHPSNSNSQAALNATMDVMIANQVFKNAISAGKQLNESKMQLKKWQQILVSLPDYEVNEDSVLKEWLHPDLKDNYHHRHVSQLYSLFNYRDREIYDDPVLKGGAEKLIRKKLEFRYDEGGGEMSFGLVQLGLSAAHLQNADMAYETVKLLASRYWSTGFGSFHNVESLFNTDISGGLPTVIIRMLAYSEEGYIHLLPALPAEWKSGSLSGALLRNQITLSSLSWNNEMIKVEMISEKDQQVEIEVPDGYSIIRKASGQNAPIVRPYKWKINLQANKDATILFRKNKKL